MELELKFALPQADALLLEKQLACVPLIGRRKPRRQTLHNTYYDTPLHALCAQRVALRVRRLGEGAQAHCVQTLKIGKADSALSQRGEWEQPLKDCQLSPQLLADTPWRELDPLGTLYTALATVFTTHFERLSWIVQLGEASVEIALDRGSVHIDGLSTPLCELEIELLSGAPAALFDAAGHIAGQLSLLPLHLSKAERAYRLAQGNLHAPRRAHPQGLGEEMDFEAMARSVLRECFLQFTANLCTLRNNAAPEVLHQARIGWRRFKSALQLFKLRAGSSGRPTLAALRTLQSQMTALRDLDVARSEVLPAFAGPYQSGDPRRTVEWQQLLTALEAESQAQRSALQQTLSEPSVGQCLLQITRWLELQALAQPTQAATPAQQKTSSASAWLRKRIARLAQQLKSTRHRAGSDAATQHHLRILSKRLRYGVESLHGVLPGKRAKRWHRLATTTQTRLGLERDRQLAIAIAQRVKAADGIIGFLRGAAYAATLDPA